MSNNNIERIVPLWDLESYEEADGLFIIEYDAEEFKEHEDNEDELSLYDRVCDGEKFKYAMRPITEEDSPVLKRTWSIARLLAHAKATGLKPDWEQ